jgi:outer membrane protein insertion porin family
LYRWKLALSVAALCAAMPLPSLGAGQTRIAILPVVVHSTDSPEFLRAGLSDMLASRLGQVKEIAVVRIDDPAAATTDIAAAQAAARASGAEYVLFGSFTRFGEGASLDLQCASVAGGENASRQVFVQAGTLGEIIPKLDDVAGRVAAYIESGGTNVPAVSAGPPRAADVSRTEVDDLRRRIDALEKAQRAATPPTSGASGPHVGAETVRDPVGQR